MTGCDPARTSAVVTTIRSSAEHVRAYGGRGLGRGLVVSTPMHLHVIAALLESEMRGWVHVDEAAAASFTQSSTAPGMPCRVIQFPELRIVATTVAPHALSTDVQVAELQSTVAHLHAAVDELDVALESAAAEHYRKLITAQANGIAAFTAAIG